MMKKVLFFIFAIPMIFVGNFIDAAVYSAEVITAGEVQKDFIEGFDIGSFTQRITVSVTDDHGTVETVEIANDFLPVKEGQDIFVRVDQDFDTGETFYSIYDLDRSKLLTWLFIGFAVIIIAFGGRRGLRSLLSLGVSIFVLFYVLMPLVAKGYSPVLWGALISIVLLGLVMALTHGLRPKTYAAFIGTSIAVIATSVLTYIVLHVGQFTGLGTEEAFALMTIGGEIDMRQLLFAGIIIGMLGVLDDVAITQAAVVMELKSVGVRGKDLYKKALHVGHEHVSALVNTLILAYAGASLPLFLLLATFKEPLPAVMSIELVAIEIIRSLIGSIGIILAVPLTTLLATFFTAKDQKDRESACAHKH